MLVSHESPLSMLKESLFYNDYDYALVHLFEEYPQYYNFFKMCLKYNRMVYLDNSIFELGEAFDTQKFADYCNSLGCMNPDNFYYVAPDVLGDAEATMQNFESFSKLNPAGKSIGVAQGSTRDEFLKCYEFMRAKADVVAICFNYKFYGSTPLAWMMGRIALVSWLYGQGLLDNTKIHLLGCSLPQEFISYKHMNIWSNDTSNPVVHGLKGIRYKEYGLDDKDHQKLIELLEANPTDEQKENILYNINKFKEINLLGA